MKNIFIFLVNTLLMVFFSSQSYAYIELSSKTTVSPGCEGGITSSSSTSIVNDPHESKKLETSQSISSPVYPKTYQE